MTRKQIIEVRKHLRATIKESYFDGPYRPSAGNDWATHYGIDCPDEKKCDSKKSKRKAVKEEYGTDFLGMDYPFEDEKEPKKDKPKFAGDYVPGEGNDFLGMDYPLDEMTNRICENVIKRLMNLK